MAQKNLVKLKSASGNIVWTVKNKKKLANTKLELKKFDKKTKKREVHKEVKK